MYSFLSSTLSPLLSWPSHDERGVVDLRGGFGGLHRGELAWVELVVQLLLWVVELEIGHVVVVILLSAEFDLFLLFNVVAFGIILAAALQLVPLGHVGAALFCLLLLLLLFGFFVGRNLVRFGRLADELGQVLRLCLLLLFGILLHSAFTDKVTLFAADLCKSIGINESIVRGIPTLLALLLGKLAGPRLLLFVFVHGLCIDENSYGLLLAFLSFALLDLCLISSSKLLVVVRKSVIRRVC